MAIVSINPNPDYTGQVGYVPRRMKMLTTDNLLTILTPGYMHSSNLQGFVVNPTDIFDIVYSYNTTTGLGTTDVFYVSINNGIITLSLAVFGGNLPSPILNPDTNVNMVTFVANATAAQLAGGALVPLLVSGGTKQYKLVTMYITSDPIATAFSGGGGDRGISISDLTTSYSVITASVIQANPANILWGTGNFSYPGGGHIGIDHTTAPGASVVISYTGGTTDYTTGTLHMYGFAIRVA